MVNAQYCCSAVVINELLFQSNTYQTISAALRSALLLFFIYAKLQQRVNAGVIIYQINWLCL